MTDPDRPIFVVAPPRTGTSLLYRCFAGHPDVGCFTAAHSRLPRFPWLAHALTRAGLIHHSPRESRKLWYRFFDHRGRRTLDATDLKDASDVTPAMRRFYGRLIPRVLALQGASRFAAKLPAHALQVPFLDALFPGALFVQPVRDWRAVVSSTVKKHAKDFSGRAFGVRPPGWREAWQRGPAYGAAWQYQWVLRHLDELAPLYRERLIRVSYEDLCRRPTTILPALFADCGLSWSDAVAAAMPDDIRPPSAAWRQHLPPDTVAQLREEFGEVLIRTEDEAPATEEAARSA